jgi:hypothetical protein
MAAFLPAFTSSDAPDVVTVAPFSTLAGTEPLRPVSIARLNLHPVRVKSSKNREKQPKTSAAWIRHLGCFSR